MSASTWPPDLKAWVQVCLSKATPANKANVNAELKDVLFRAHKDGTINNTDWSKVELQALKAQTIRTTHIPVPPARPFPTVIPPPATVTQYPVYVPPAPSSYASSSTLEATPTKKEKKKSKANKKRKTESTTTDNFPSPYHFTGPEAGPDDPDALARRAARFNKPSSSVSGAMARPVGVNAWFGGEDEEDSAIPGFGQVGKKRIRVHGNGEGGARFAEPIAEEDPNVIDWDRYTIKGTSTKLEKRYLRLTSEPDPAEIRPLRVLEQSLQLVVQNWKDNRNYAYAVDQFKSMRQDLTVQRIKNEFTVKVYEYHARVALEAKDLGEYNQCQTMLRQLYELGIHGHFEEFLSYRILYLLHTRNRSDMASLLPKLTLANKADPGVQHALQVAAAVATSNYYKIFQLYETAPNMSGFIMDHFVERERISALAIMAKSHMTLTLPYLTKTLAFESDTIADKFLVDHDIALYSNPTLAPAPTASANHWRPIKAQPPTPLRDLVWDCKKALIGVRKGMERYRVVDLKGQVD